MKREDAIYNKVHYWLLSTLAGILWLVTVIMLFCKSGSGGLMYFIVSGWFIYEYILVDILYYVNAEEAWWFLHFPDLYKLAHQRREQAVKANGHLRQWDDSLPPIWNYFEEELYT